MALVDADDDNVERWVVRLYAYDPDRHERRHQVVAAFDNEAEYRVLFDDRAARLKQRRLAGEEIDPREHISGVYLEPGYRRRQQHRRLIDRAISHGADISGILDTLELPSNISIARSVREETPGQ